MLHMPSEKGSSQDACPLLCGARALFAKTKIPAESVITCPQCGKFRIDDNAIRFITDKLSKFQLPFVRRAAQEAVELLHITEGNIERIASDQEGKETREAENG
jgi:hypothetical protein